ncbi:MAG: hypothetical protein H6R15_854 [Proteobacteria bacterium]|nr:hypothetical protein [Pseudomonadota bacterium]
MSWRYCAGRHLSLAEPLFSALRGVLLSFASPKESKQRKGDPRVGALRVLCATRQSGRLAKLACGSDNANRKPPDRLRCSAPLMGTRKASWNDGSAQEQKVTFFSGRLLEIRKNEYCRFGGDAFPGPHVERRATQVLAEKARGLSEGRSPEFRSALNDAQHREEVLLGCARQCRVAQGSRRSRPRSLGSPSSLATFFLAKQEESTPARKAEPPRKTNSAPTVAETPDHQLKKSSIPLP